ncbi:hypothetical protein GJW-30_1_02568 [Variibacter gotjawalensis]|uniref:Regulator of CtrA degradation n=1 Tax=Variibacter gotjawalensis TaxID=1333996 RepID=A0A0S3PVR7_9BRAD|nr:DUF1465 family protein [Variibacter gotjawalensis]NIK45856.1 regulator of CtrA degradation [Variibacter gotjawalensis]RZS47779.1 regulator of CtrA degradation [Variibacter gotjawalensis]BAT60033.1 hypothetical protein GJW-30_1_02568 [Variibacter gotjawalensis]
MAELSEGLQPVRLTDRLSNSPAFTALFREGMSLVEETAAYLDGDGRREAKGLERAAALAYATESMRLTTRLMQVASWLLLHRAVNEGEMSLTQAERERHKVNIVVDRRDSDSESHLPERLRELIEGSFRVQQRVRHLDSGLRRGSDVIAAENDNPVGRQQNLLSAAFGR